MTNRIYFISKLNLNDRVKKLAGIPIKSFDPKCIDSDLETIRSDLVREKINQFKVFRKIEPIQGIYEMILFYLIFTKIKII